MIKLVVVIVLSSPPSSIDFPSKIEAVLLLEAKLTPLERSNTENMANRSPDQRQYTRGDLETLEIAERIDRS